VGRALTLFRREHLHFWSPPRVIWQNSLFDLSDHQQHSTPAAQHNQKNPSIPTSFWFPAEEGEEVVEDPPVPSCGRGGVAGGRRRRVGQGRAGECLGGWLP
jgi:hypothetical protein